MTDRAKERDLRYQNWLDQIIEALREDRRRDAADVINRVPVEEAGDFVLYLAIHINGQFDVMKRQAREAGQLLREYEERKREWEVSKRQFRDHVRRDTMEKLEMPPDLAAAQQRVRELEEVVAEQEKLITALRQVGLN